MEVNAALEIAWRESASSRTLRPTSMMLLTFVAWPETLP
jgi:hypothetical protein